MCKGQPILILYKALSPITHRISQMIIEHKLLTKNHVFSFTSSSTAKPWACSRSMFTCLHHGGKMHGFVFTKTSFLDCFDPVHYSLRRSAEWADRNLAWKY